MKRLALATIAACGIGVSTAAGAIPPPYVPPPAPEIVAAADALVEQIPIEQWVNAAVEIQPNGDSRLGWAVTSELVDHYVAQPPHGMSRDELKLLLYHPIARRLPALAPSVIATMRTLISSRFQGGFSQARLVVWRRAIESAAGRDALDALLTADLLNGLLARDEFISRLLPEREALVRAALAGRRETGAR